MKTLQVCFCALFFLVSSFSVAYSDGGNEFEPAGTLRGDRANGTSMKITREYSNPSRAKQFKSVTVKYKLSINLENADGESVKKYEVNGSLAAGKENAVFDLSKYINELKKVMKTHGTVVVDIYPEGTGNLNISGSQYMHNLTNDAMVKDAVSNPDQMAKFGQDYADFIMKNPGKPKSEADKEFLKKYPQYKKYLSGE